MDSFIEWVAQMGLIDRDCAVFSGDNEGFEVGREVVSFVSDAISDEGDGPGEGGIGIKRGGAVWAELDAAHAGGQKGGHGVDVWIERPFVEGDAGVLSKSGHDQGALKSLDLAERSDAALAGVVTADLPGFVLRSLGGEEGVEVAVEAQFYGLSAFDGKGAGQLEILAEAGGGGEHLLGAPGFGPTAGGGK